MNSIPRYISADQVHRLLTWPLVNTAVEEAMKATAAPIPDGNGDGTDSSFVYQPPRVLTKCGGGTSQILFCMPGFVGNYQLPVTFGGAGDVPVQKVNRSTLACKLVTSFSDNERHKLPNVLANILLFNTETGQLDCIMDGTHITARRTAAASIVATKYLYLRRFPDFTKHPIKLGIIGCGVQGENHALGMCATFCVTHVFLWNRTPAKAQILAEILQQAAPDVIVMVTANAADAVAESDVVCVGTFSPEALINYAMLKKPSVHINTVGAGEVHFGEIAQDIYDEAAEVYVDCWASAKIELKDLKANIIAEVGEIIHSGKCPPEKGITIFQSMGMAAEDATVAQAIFDASGE